MFNNYFVHQRAKLYWTTDVHTSVNCISFKIQ